MENLDPNHHLLTQQNPRRRSSMIASSRAESILISSSGDVVVCRCRDSPYPLQKLNNEKSDGGGWNGYEWGADLTNLCCQQGDASDDLSTQMQDTTTLCSPWKQAPRKSNRGGGLLGGAPAAQVATPFHHHDARLRGGGLYGDQRLSPSSSDHSNPHHNTNDFHPSVAQKAFRSPPLPDIGFDEDSIIPIKSFDYSSFYDDGNEMLSPQYVKEEQQPQPASISPPYSSSPSRTRQENVQTPEFIHGVPTFLHDFSNVKITQLSAHPLGAHVLLISDAGLLYSYGLNDYGQLGIGIQTNPRGPHRGYAMTPTIVTPLVENGGKTIACAAGVNHSLVVVQTQEERIVKSRSMDKKRYPSTPCFNSSSRIKQAPRSQSEACFAGIASTTTESVLYHQVYGFGRNDYMKIGLVSPKMAQNGSDEMEVAVLPRRVALRCTVHTALENNRQHEQNQLPPPGIFAIEASVEHSAALVRRASGDIQLYTWGNAIHGALGLPAQGGSTHGGHVISQSVRLIPVPSYIASLSSTTSNTPTLNEASASPSLLREKGEYPAQVALGPHCTFVLTSAGRCFSFGESEDGMLGHGSGVTEQDEPREISLPEGEKFRAVSAGVSHVVATMESGKVFGWGARPHAGLPCENAAAMLRQDDPMNAGDTTMTPMKNHKPRLDPRLIQWSPKWVEIVPPTPSGVCATIAKNAKKPKQSDRIVEVCAGNGCSYFVAESGRVYSTGMRSGRIGQGEMTEDFIDQPTPLFGGLHLWWKPKHKNPIYPVPVHHDPQLLQKKPPLKRGFTLG